MKKLFTPETIVGSFDWESYIAEKPEFNYLFKPETRIYNIVNQRYNEVK